MIPVFYHPSQSCDAAVGFSPSAGKPAQVIADWNKHFLGDIEIRMFEPVSDLVLEMAHDPDYVQGVLYGEIDNGFGNCDLQVANSLRYTVGSMVAAAKHVMTQTFSEERVACSPTSGFHHAGYDYGGGFCTFNGLMVTAMLLKNLGLVNRVLILDFDAHYGNGTQHIIDHFKADWVTHITAGKSYTSSEDVKSILSALKPYVTAHDLVLYQAGADIHVDDPLGGILTKEQMRERDKRIMRTCCQYGVPLVWNLAGGYQRDKNGGIDPVLALHRQTMDVCIEEYL